MEMILKLLLAPVIFIGNLFTIGFTLFWQTVIIDILMYCLLPYSTYYVVSQFLFDCTILATIGFSIMATINAMFMPFENK